MKLLKERGHAPAANYGAGDAFFDMKIMILAQRAAQAQKAMNLLVSSIAVIEGAITFCPEPFSVEPWEAGITPYTKSFVSKTGLLEACERCQRLRRGRKALL